MLKPLSFRLCICLLSVVLCSCEQTSSLDWNSLEKKYASRNADSIKLKALYFLKTNIDSLESEKLIFYNNESELEVEINLDTISSEESLQKIIKINDLSNKSTKIADKNILTTKDIAKTLDTAFATRVKYSWSKNISDSLFLNYVLPYKIATEYPKDWRLFFLNKYEKKLDSLNKIGITSVERVTKFLVDDLESWYTYDTNNFLFSQFPDLDELLYSSKGECYRVACLYTYALRSAGIPFGKTSGTPQPVGFSDIEFEVAIFGDLINSLEGNSLTASSSEGYSNFIKGLTSNATHLLNAKNYFAGPTVTSAYFTYLEEFKAKYPAYSTPRANLMPKAIEYLIQNTDCATKFLNQ